MKSRISTLAHSPTSELTRRYVIALVAIGMLLVTGQILLEFEFRSEADETYDMFDAGRAQTQSQTLTRLSLQILHTSPGEQQQFLAGELRSVIEKLETRTRLLREGDTDMQRVPENRKAVLAVLDSIEPARKAILHHARAILDSVGHGNTGDIALHVEALLRHEKAFTGGMTRILYTLIEANRQQIQWLRYAQLSLFGITAVIILLSSLYIFRPAVWKVRNTIRNLLETQETLRQSEERFSKIFHSAPLAICIAAFSDGKILVVNKSFEELTGYSSTDLVGKNSFDAALGLDRDVLAGFKHEVTASGSVYNTSLRIQTGIGESRQVLASVDSIMIDNRACLIFTIKDVTELMRFTRRIEEQEVYYRSLIENSTDIITVLNADGTIRYSSTSVMRALGYRPEGIVGRSFLDFVDQEDRSQMTSLLDTVRTAPGRVVPANSFRLVRSNGALLEFEAVMSNLLDNLAVGGIVVNSRDISDRRKAESELQLSEKKFSTIFQIAPVAITITSFLESTFLDVNEAYLELTGYTREELIGRTVDEVNLQPDKERRSTRRAVTDFERVINFETEIITKAGITKHVLVSLDHIEIDGRMCVLALTADISSRKDMEEALRQSEHRFAQVFSSSPAGISISTLSEGRFIDVNASFCAMLGFSRKELVGATAPELRLLDEQTSREALVRQLEEHGHFTGMELVLRKKNGEHCYYLNSAELITLDGQKCILNIGLDITEQKRQEELRRQFEERFSKVFYASPIPILITTEQEGDIVDANESYVRLSGYTREELLGKNVIDLNLITYSEDRQNLLRILAHQNSLSGVQGWMQTKSGQRRILLVSVERISLGGVPHLLKMALDVTDRVRTETALEASEIRFRSLFDLAAVGIGLVDMNGQWLLVNQKLCDIMGYSRSEFASPEFPRLTHPDDLPADNEYVQRLLQNDISEFTLEKRYLRRDGTLIWGRTTASLVRSPDGAPLYFIRVVQEITDQKQAQETLRLSEERFSRIFHSAPIATVLFRLDDRRIQDVNKSFEKLTQYSRDEILGRTDRELGLVTGENRQALLEGPVPESSVPGFEARLTSKNGTEHVVLVSLERVVINATPCVIGMLQDITELKAATRRIRQQEQYFRSLIEHSSDTILVLDADLHLTYVSPSCRKNLGYEPDELPGNTGIPFLHPDDAPAVSELLDKLLHQPPEESVRIERLRVLHRDGSVRFLEATCTSLFHDDSISGLVVNCRDITERCMAEEELQETNLRLHSTFEQAAVGIAHVDAEGRWLRVNRKLCDITGYSREELLTLTFQEITHPDDLGPDLALAFQLFNGDISSYTLEKRYIRRDGSSTWVNLTVSAVRDRQGMFKFYISVVEDISRRKNAEKAHEESEQRFHQIADVAPVMVWMAGPDKLCTFFNKGWLDFTGRTLEQERGNGWTELLHPDDYERCLSVYTTAFDARQSFSMEYRLRRHDGEYRWLLDNGVPYYQPDGSFAGYIGSCVDITDIRQTSQELLASVHTEQTQHRLQNLFLSHIGRELRTPLHGIAGFAYLLEQELAASEYQAYARIIHDSARFLMQAISNIIVLAQLESDTFDDPPARIILQNEVALAVEAVRREAQDKGLALRYEATEEELVLFTSQRLLHQILDNLLHNALKFTARGTISVRVYCERQESRTLAVVEIEDTGTGISPDFLPYIFDDYTQELQGDGAIQTGLGLGLTVVKKAVEYMSASAQVRSVKNAGSVISVRIPATE